jgi:U3 small nucleolar RNA-associated protein 15
MNSGSYDGTVKLWDIRQGSSSSSAGSSGSSSSSSSSGAALSVTHDAPVEACMYLPGGGLFVTAGGNYLKVCMSIIATVRILMMLQLHSKYACRRLSNFY